MMLFVFFLLTFALTWTAWLAPALLGAGNSGFAAMGGPIFLLGVFAPGLVAIALTAYSDGWDGVGQLVVRIGRWRANVGLYLFALGYMAAIQLLAAVIHRIVLGNWPMFRDVSLPVILGGILVSMWVQAGEELGWRGYAFPRLAAYVGLRAASILLGLIWALWHLPLFYLPGSGSDGQSFPMYLLHVTALSVAISWLYWMTKGSLLLVMLMHASVNNTIGIVPASVRGASNAMSFAGSFVGWSMVAVSATIAAYLLTRMRGAEIWRVPSTESRRAKVGEQ